MSLTYNFTLKIAGTSCDNVRHCIASSRLASQFSGIRCECDISDKYISYRSSNSFWCMHNILLQRKIDYPNVFEETQTHWNHKTNISHPFQPIFGIKAAGGRTPPHCNCGMIWAHARMHAASWVCLHRRYRVRARDRMMRIHEHSFLHNTEHNKEYSVVHNMIQASKQTNTQTNESTNAFTLKISRRIGRHCVSEARVYACAKYMAAKWIHVRNACHMVENLSLQLRLKRSEWPGNLVVYSVLVVQRHIIFPFANFFFLGSLCIVYFNFSLYLSVCLCACACEMCMLLCWCECVCFFYILIQCVNFAVFSNFYSLLVNFAIHKENGNKFGVYAFFSDALRRVNDATVNRAFGIGSLCP